MTNLLQNPTMDNWQHIRYYTDQQGKTGTIEAPAHWEYVYTPKESDPNKIAQSLHRDDGFILSAGYRAWEAGYKQSHISLAAGNRYRLKARFKADVNFPGGQAPDLSAITWRFTIATDAGNLEQDWAMTSKEKTKQIEEFEFIFDVNQPITSASITFWARSFYAGNDCDFWIYEITLEAIEKVSGAIVPSIGTTSSAQQPLPDTEPHSVQTTEQLAVSDVGDILNELDQSQKSLGDAKITVEEIQLIAGALRSLGVGTNDQSTADGLNKLAEVLERLL